MIVMLKSIFTLTLNILTLIVVLLTSIGFSWLTCKIINPILDLIDEEEDALSALYLTNGFLIIANFCVSWTNNYFLLVFTLVTTEYLLFFLWFVAISPPEELDELGIDQYDALVALVGLASFCLSIPLLVNYYQDIVITRPATGDYPVASILGQLQIPGIITFQEGPFWHYLYFFAVWVFNIARTWFVIWFIVLLGPFIELSCDIMEAVPEEEDDDWTPPPHILKMIEEAKLKELQIEEEERQIAKAKWQIEKAKLEEEERQIKEMYRKFEEINRKNKGL